MSHFLSPILKEPRRDFSLVDANTRTVVAVHLEGAFDSASRRKGLLGRDSLPPGTAIAIAPCNSIHTFFMRFPIDVAFVRKNGEVVKVSHAVPAWRIRLSPRAFAVIELAAGVLAKWGVVPGHILEVSEIPASR